MSQAITQEFEKLNTDIKEGYDDPIVLDGNIAMEKLIKKYE